MSSTWSLFSGKNAKLNSDGGSSGLASLETYASCVVAEYVWLDAAGVPRSKTKTLSAIPRSVSDLPVWNFDGSSTEQAPGHDSEVLLNPVAIFKDPFRGGNHILVLAECVLPVTMEPAIGNNRAPCKAVMDKYNSLDAWFGIEQEYTLMAPRENGIISDVPLGFNADGSEPAPQGPYYCGAGTNYAIGREVAEKHYEACLYAGIKVAGVNAEVMPGQWEYQVGPCRGIEMGDHLSMSRYIMYRVTELCNIQVTFHPKPRTGDWNGAGCHTNFSIAAMRKDGGYEVIKKVCEAFGVAVKEHVTAYGDEDNAKRLTGQHETCSINEFKFGVADRGASIRIPRDTEKDGKGYMEDRRPAANCDPYRVTGRMLQTTGDFLATNPAVLL